MKLKKLDVDEMDEPVTAATTMMPESARLQFDSVPGSTGAGKVATLIAVLASLAAAAMVGAVAAMMYVNWELIANA